MQQKVWYKKKRVYLLAILCLLFCVTKMEWAKMRYDKEVFLTSLRQYNSDIVGYDTRTVGNKTIHFIKKFSSAQLPILLMVHGSPGSLSAYEAYLKDEQLSKKFNLISVDRSGFGYSDFGQAEASLKIQSDLIAAILKDYPNQQKIVLGHSMGGPVIAKLAMNYPNLVDGLVMIAPSISPALEPSNSWRKIMDFALIRWLTPAGLRVCNQEIIPLKKELLDIQDQWSQINIPTRIVQGEADRLVPPGNAFFAKEAMINNDEVNVRIIKNGNHFILWSEVSLIIEETMMLLEMI